MKNGAEILREVAYEEGYKAGKASAVEQVIERVKAESALNIAGITHYVVTDHDLAIIAKAVLEGLSNE